MDVLFPEMVIRVHMSHCGLSYDEVERTLEAKVDEGPR